MTMKLSNPLTPIGFASCDGHKVSFTNQVGELTNFHGEWTTKAGIRIILNSVPVYFIGFSHAHFILIYGNPLTPDHLSTGTFTGSFMAEFVRKLANEA